MNLIKFLGMMPSIFFFFFNESSWHSEKQERQLSAFLDYSLDFYFYIFQLLIKQREIFSEFAFRF